MEVSVELHALATLLPWKRMNGPQIQSGHCGEEKRIPYPCWESNSGHPAHSPPLYQINYRLRGRYNTKLLFWTLSLIQVYYNYYISEVYSVSVCVKVFLPRGQHSRGSLSVVRLKTEIEPFSETWLMNFDNEQNLE